MVVEGTGEHEELPGSGDKQPGHDHHDKTTIMMIKIVIVISITMMTMEPGWNDHEQLSIKIIMTRGTLITLTLTTVEDDYHYHMMIT